MMPKYQELKDKGRFIRESGGYEHEIYELNGKRYIAYFDRRGVQTGIGEYHDSREIGNRAYSTNHPQR